MSVALISKVDKQLQIPPKMRGIFPNEQWLIIDLKAGVPKVVPDYVAKYMVKNYPRIFRLATEAEVPPPVNPLFDGLKPPPPPELFDAVGFITANYLNMPEAIKEVENDRKKLYAIAKELNFRNFARTTNQRLAEMIVHDVEVKNRQAAELEKHKDVK